ncbi:Hypothetical predicted protein [Olea europaea subsp. europaea]|uniref:Uncharacterized protein n=1 Tax=Olea europaea subsp. europaea TaxID=158383 RepID=A0A8S0V1U1_OLEEU|nr:Hypothetical predicted protein [Olea europaea subsp. europaea]
MTLPELGSAGFFGVRELQIWPLSELCITIFIVGEQWFQFGGKALRRAMMGWGNDLQRAMTGRGISPSPEAKFTTIMRVKSMGKRRRDFSFWSSTPLSASFGIVNFHLAY